MDRRARRRSARVRPGRDGHRRTRTWCGRPAARHERGSVRLVRVGLWRATRGCEPGRTGHWRRASDQPPAEDSRARRHHRRRREAPRLGRGPPPRIGAYGPVTKGIALNTVLVLGGIHAAAQLVAAFPERAIEIRFPDRHFEPRLWTTSLSARRLTPVRSLGRSYIIFPYISSSLRHCRYIEKFLDYRPRAGRPWSPHPTHCPSSPSW